MNKNVLIVLGGAVVVAILVAVLVQAMLGGKQEQVIVEQPKVSILVAAKDLRLGVELQEGDMEWQEWPENTVFSAAIRKKDDQKPLEALEGRLARGVAKGEPMVKSAMLAQSKGNFVAASLEAGMRAIAIDVDASSMVAGFVEPGDFVDIILTYKESIKSDDDDPRVQEMIEMNIDKLATETILQNVKILAVDQRAEPPQGEEKIKVGKTVTVAVSMQDAERLALASELGDLDLILRGVGDDKVVERDWQTISDARLTTMNDEIFTEYRKMKKDTSINPNIVRIYNGNTVQVISAK